MPQRRIVRRAGGSRRYPNRWLRYWVSELEESLFGVYSHLVSIGFASPDEMKNRVAIATLERYKQAIMNRKNGNYLQRSLRAETTNKVRAKRRKLEHRGGSLKERRPRTYIYAPCSATWGKDTIHLPYPTSVKKNRSRKTLHVPPAMHGVDKARPHEITLWHQQQHRGKGAFRASHLGCCAGENHL